MNKILKKNWPHRFETNFKNIKPHFTIKIIKNMEKFYINKSEALLMNDEYVPL